MARYHNIEKCSTVNGEGVRLSVFLSGCPHHCKGCFSPQTWNPKSGLELDEEAYKEIIGGLEDKYCTGLTLLGGDPLAPYNLEDSLKIAKLCKDIGKTVWCYTGYLYEEVKDLEVMKYIDVLVDGKFVEPLSSKSARWKGSTNQRVILVQESLEQGEIVFHSDNDK